MKPSRYNYYITCKDKEIVFNGITKRFFFLSEKNRSRIVSILNTPDSVGGDKRFHPFLDRMLHDGFLVDDNDTEATAVKRLFENERCPNQYMLMIMPTYKCNLRCWYCIQDHQDVDLSDLSVEHIKSHIRKYLFSNKIKRFRLSWFGGEPLLAYKKVVGITAFARKECERQSVDFFCDVTTNSLMLNSARIKELGELGVRRFQITIDGCREKHNAIKKTIKGSAFDDALSNITEIVRCVQDVECVLRINYSDDTLELEKIINDICQKIPCEYRRKVKITPCKIWQVEESVTTKGRVSDLNALAIRQNYRVETGCKRMCYVDYAHFNCIFPNGMVGKCENDNLEEARGRLTDKGDIVWEDTYPYENYTVFSDGSECANCRHLPFCMGPCPQKRNKMFIEHGKIVCQFQNAAQTIEERIVRYCENNSSASLVNGK